MVPAEPPWADGRLGIFLWWSKHWFLFAPNIEVSLFIHCGTWSHRKHTYSLVRYGKITIQQGIFYHFSVSSHFIPIRNGSGVSSAPAIDPGRIWWLQYWKTVASQKSRITGIPSGISRYMAVRTPKYPQNHGWNMLEDPWTSHVGEKSNCFVSVFFVRVLLPLRCHVQQTLWQCLSPRNWWATQAAPRG